MRITCPNCGAQYEVPDEVIPKDGRDVQCSECGATWFQDKSGKSDMISVPDQADATPGADAPDPAAASAEPGDIDAPADDEEYQEAPLEQVERQRMDPSVEDILRQEGEREAAARAAEASDQLETQPDLGLSEGDDEAQRRAREARDRMAKLRGAPTEEDEPDIEPTLEAGSDESETTAKEAAATAAAMASRRELLPDIEEINSTLRSASDRDVAGDDLDPEAPGRIRKRRGFRRGFTLSFLVFVMALLVYVFAPEISQSVPQLAPGLAAYVEWVDTLRVALDARMQAILQWLDAQAAASSSS